MEAPVGANKKTAERRAVTENCDVQETERGLGEYPKPLLRYRGEKSPR